MSTACLAEPLVRSLSTGTAGSRVRRRGAVLIDRPPLATTASLFDQPPPAVSSVYPWLDGCSSQRTLKLYSHRYALDVRGGHSGIDRTELALPRSSLRYGLESTAPDLSKSHTCAGSQRTRSHAVMGACRRVVRSRRTGTFHGTLTERTSFLVEERARDRIWWGDGQPPRAEDNVVGCAQGHERAESADGAFVIRRVGGCRPGRPASLCV